MCIIYAQIICAFCCRYACTKLAPNMYKEIMLPAPSPCYKGLYTFSCCREEDVVCSLKTINLKNKNLVQKKCRSK